MTRGLPRGAVAGLRAYRPDDVRAAETAALAAAAAGALMQHAAAALAALCARELRGRTGGISGRAVVLLVGTGDNGGDALWAGARLRGRGVAVTALLTGDRAHPGGVAALRAAGGRVLRVVDGADPRSMALLASAHLVVDGLVGLGGRPGLAGAAQELVGLVPAATPVVAVDVPSGVDVATGATPGPHVRADVTLSLGAATACLLLPPAAAAAGRIEQVDLGFTPVGGPLVERLDAAAVGGLWPVPGRGDDKYRRGVLGVVAGSSSYPGAAVLATAGALRAGVGMLRYIGPDDVTAAVRSAHPEVVAGDGRVQAWVLGSGVDASAGGEQPAAIARALHRAAEQGLPCLVDAGGLQVLARTRRPAGVPEDVSHRVLLTPHAGELATLLGALGVEVDRAAVEAEPYTHAWRAAELTGACVLLKGAVTLVVLPSGRARSQAEAPPWLATAGAGDVLAGIAGALLAAGLTPWDAAAVAASVHGRAAALAAGTRPGHPGGPITAGDVATHVPAAVATTLSRTTPTPHRDHARAQR